ncbi:hypothetical protein CEXT_611231 [Caerostris extrusa]|uniref:Uncharacterized protein n=1 Tax=Caerostris extrusa TaxID=172846 RepID=A0AAV4MLR3_CAEEX|nr:hypothetical protein CEXT_611231 [Caerostris extrusa]
MQKEVGYTVHPLSTTTPKDRTPRRIAFSFLPLTPSCRTFQSTDYHLLPKYKQGIFLARLACQEATIGISITLKHSPESPGSPKSRDAGAVHRLDICIGACWPHPLRTDTELKLFPQRK